MYYESLLLLGLSFPTVEIRQHAEPLEYASIVTKTFHVHLDLFLKIGFLFKVKF